MQLTIFGASGRIGRLVTYEALRQGHSVVAFVHSTNPFEAQPGLTVMTGDITDKQAVSKAIADSGAVLSTLGSWGTKTKDIVSSGMQTIIPAMEAIHSERLITLTGSAATWSGDSLRLRDKVNRFILGHIAPKILQDGEAHLRLLESSSLQWTSLRAPVMLDKQSTTYRLDNIIGSPFEKISRHAVTVAMLDQLTDTTWLKQAPVIH